LSAQPNKEIAKFSENRDFCKHLVCRVWKGLENGAGVDCSTLKDRPNIVVLEILRMQIVPDAQCVGGEVRSYRMGLPFLRTSELLQSQSKRAYNMATTRNMSENGSIAKQKTFPIAASLRLLRWYFCVFARDTRRNGVLIVSASERRTLLPRLGSNIVRVYSG
jgi:hypothetical protein